MGDEIGAGEFGIVMEGQIRSTSEKIAIKLLKIENPESIDRFKQEAIHLRALNHNNVVRMIGTQFESHPFMILFEHMANGDLKSYLSIVRDAVELNHILKLVSDVSAGFAYLQCRKFVHRDLAARIVLLDLSFSAKISDFGMARQLFASDYYRQGSTGASWILPLRWMAPESFTDGSWDLRTDVWMFGVLIWEIFSRGKIPWAGLQDRDVIHNIQLRAKLEQPEICPNEFYYDIMLSCWRLDPFARISGGAIETRVQQYIAENNMHSKLINLTWPVKEDYNAIQEQEIDVDLESEKANHKVQGLEIDMKTISIGVLLGHGAFGEVHSGILKVNEMESVQVAVKTMKGQCTREEQHKFADEAKLFTVLTHPNIVKCIGVHLQSHPLLIVLELMQCDIKSYFKKTITVSSYMLSNVTLQIASAMKYLSAKKIIHRDLAARNVLVGNEGLSSVKLNDFGLSRTLSTSNYYKKNSLDQIPVKWMAPESVIDRKYSSASDTWSFGVFCWEVFEHGKTPYPDVIIENMMNYILRGKRMAKPQGCPDALYDLMLQCWQLDSSARPTFSTLVTMIEEIAEGEEESRL